MLISILMFMGTLFPSEFTLDVLNKAVAIVNEDKNSYTITSKFTPIKSFDPGKNKLENQKQGKRYCIIGLAKYLKKNEEDIELELKQMKTLKNGIENDLYLYSIEIKKDSIKFK